MQWRCGRFLLNFDSPKIMGIVNVTPDSFYDGNTYSKSVKSTILHCEKLVKEGCDILDIGGESTRPGSSSISFDIEWGRVSLVLQEVSKWNIPISLDTRNSLTMHQALSLGYVDIINDISGLSDVNSLSVIKEYSDIGLCIMHMQGAPQTMQINPSYGDVYQEVLYFLAENLRKITESKIDRNRVVIDPGIGFGKLLSHNISLLKFIPKFKEYFKLPLLVGVSRKSMLGEIIKETDPSNNMIASIAILPNLFNLGVDIVRVHDVKESVQCLKIWNSLR